MYIDVFMCICVYINIFVIVEFYDFRKSNFLVMEGYWDDFMG